MSELNRIIFNIFMYPFEKMILNKRRKEIIPMASGKVLEIGAGGGSNFSYYNIKNIDSLSVIDVEFGEYIKKDKLNDKMRINYREGNIENIPFEDNTFDSVVATLIFCAVDNQRKALEEVRRVLKPSGKLYFIEHIVPDSDGYKKIANTCNSTWHKIGKCNINRETHKTIKETGFKINNFEIFGKGCFVFIKGIAINNK